MPTLTDAAKHVAATLHGSFDTWTPWVTLDDGRAIRATLEPDHDTWIGDRYHADSYGKIYDASRGEGTRPAECNGAARKLATRGGMIWWQPPEDVLAESADVLESLATRVKEYFLEGWSFVGVVVETRGVACSCCGETKTTRESVWAVESDATAEYLEELVADFIPRPEATA